MSSLHPFGNPMNVNKSSRLSVYESRRSIERAAKKLSNILRDTKDAELADRAEWWEDTKAARESIEEEIAAVVQEYLSFGGTALIAGGDNAEVGDENDWLREEILEIKQRLHKPNDAALTELAIILQVLIDDLGHVEVTKALEKLGSSAASSFQSQVDDEGQKLEAQDSLKLIHRAVRMFLKKDDGRDFDAKRICNVIEEAGKELRERRDNFNTNFERGAMAMTLRSSPERENADETRTLQSPTIGSDTNQPTLPAIVSFHSRNSDEDDDMVPSEFLDENDPDQEFLTGKDSRQVDRDSDIMDTSQIVVDSRASETGDTDPQEDEDMEKQSTDTERRLHQREMLQLEMRLQDKEENLELAERSLRKLRTMLITNKLFSKQASLDSIKKNSSDLDRLLDIPVMKFPVKLTLQTTPTLANDFPVFGSRPSVADFEIFIQVICQDIDDGKLSEDGSIHLEENLLWLNQFTPQLGRSVASQLALPRIVWFLNTVISHEQPSGLGLPALFMTVYSLTVRSRDFSLWKLVLEAVVRWGGDRALPGWNLLQQLTFVLLVSAVPNQSHLFDDMVNDDTDRYSKLYESLTGRNFSNFCAFLSFAEVKEFAATDRGSMLFAIDGSKHDKLAVMRTASSGGIEREYIWIQRGTLVSFFDQRLHIKFDHLWKTWVQPMNAGKQIPWFLIPEGQFSNYLERYHDDEAVRAVEKRDEEDKVIAIKEEGTIE